MKTIKLLTILFVTFCTGYVLHAPRHPPHALVLDLGDAWAKGWQDCEDAYQIKWITGHGWILKTNAGCVMDVTNCVMDVTNIQAGLEAGVRPVNPYWK